MMPAGRVKSDEDAQAREVPANPNRPAWLLLPVAFWALGLLVNAWPAIVSGFGEVLGHLGDSRLVNFTLEHSYRWLMGLPLAEDLWSPPIFFPQEGAAFFTDLLLGVAPLYWPWRWLGAEPHTAYQLWMLVSWSLNFLAFYLMLRRGLRVKLFGASAGAYLFAFGNTRFANLVHQQIVPQFFLVLVLWAAIEIVFKADKRDRPMRAWLWVSIGFTGLFLQLITAVYPTVFFLLGTAATVLIVLTFRSGRTVVAETLRHNAIPLVVCGALITAVALPFVSRYVETAEIVGSRMYSINKLPHALSWLLMGSRNVLYGWLHSFDSLRWARLSPHHNGIGVVTLIACVAGLWHGRRNRIVQLVVVAVAVLFVVTLRMPGDWSLWKIVRDLMPGATALRAIGRVGLVLLYPASLGLALTFDWLAEHRRWRFAAALFAIIAVEQLNYPLTFNIRAQEERIEAIAKSVPDDATAFHLVTTGPTGDRQVHNDAAWVAFASGVPTTNGRYGNRPRGWRLGRAHIWNAKRQSEIEMQLQIWCGLHDLSPEDVAWVEFRGRPRETR